MKKEVKIEHFVSKDELDAMTEKEREIYEKVFLMNKQNLQGLTDALDMINEPQDQSLLIADVSGEYCPICQSDDLVDIDDHYTKCCKCGFSFVG